MFRYSLPKLLVISLLLTKVAFSQSNQSRLSTEALGAKALIEELLAKRLSNDLASRIQRDSFNLGAQLELAPNAKKENPLQDEPISDLALGNLDPEELIKKFTNTTDNNSILSFLDKFRIRAVEVSVGLSEALPPEAKEEVEKWLQARLNSEFGAVAKGTVSIIKSPTKNLEQELSFWQRLERLQELAGQVILALAILAGLFLWKMLSNPASKDGEQAGAATNVSINNGAAEGSGGSKRSQSDIITDEAERKIINQSIEEYTQKIRDVVPRLSTDFERIIQSWCQTGETGLQRLACFAEAVGKDIGRLPIPPDSIADLTKIFAKMSSIEILEKRRLLEFCYWDILSVLNLGPEAINQPFSYLGAMSPNKINQVLIDQNPRLRSIVSYYLPTEVRKNYLKELSSESKRELLQSAGQLLEVESKELNEYNANLRVKFKPDQGKQVVTLANNVAKLVESFTPIEELRLLSGLTGPAFDEFKRTSPSLGYLDQWSEASLQKLLNNTSTDEIVSFLRIKPECKDQFVALCPPLTATMVKDEITATDTTSDATKNQHLTKLKDRIVELVQAKEVSLDDLSASALEPADSKAA